MSKRYGRNRKRLHLARIGELEAAVQRLREEVAGQCARENNLREALGVQAANLRELVAAIEAVSLNSALLPPKVMEVGPYPGPYRLVTAHRFTLQNLGSTLTEDEVTIETVDVEEVRFLLKDDIFRRAVHVLLTRGGEVTGYALSLHAYDHFLLIGGLPRVAAAFSEELLKALRARRGRP